MTPDEQNALIARHTARDPEWRTWAYVPCEHWLRERDGDVILGRTLARDVCPMCRGTGRVPRDFAAHWPKLVEWAAQQEWYLAGATFEQSCCYRLGQAVLVFVEGRSTSAEVGENVRDIIAARLKEMDHAD